MGHHRVEAPALHGGEHRRHASRRQRCAGGRGGPPTRCRCRTLGSSARKRSRTAGTCEEIRQRSVSPAASSAYSVRRLGAELLTSTSKRRSAKRAAGQVPERLAQRRARPAARVPRVVGEPQLARGAPARRTRSCRRRAPARRRTTRACSPARARLRRHARPAACRADTRGGQRSGPDGVAQEQLVAVAQRPAGASRRAPSSSSAAEHAQDVARRRRPAGGASVRNSSSSTPSAQQRAVERRRRPRTGPRAGRGARGGRARAAARRRVVELDDVDPWRARSAGDRRRRRAG